MRIIIISIMISLLTSNYLEDLELPFLMKIRNLVYFGELNNKVDGKVKYKFNNSNNLVNPVSVAQLSLEDAQCVLNKFYKPIPFLICREDKLIDSKNIIKSANLLIDMIEIHEHNKIKFGMLPYNFDLPIYQLKSPWYSGMAQGHAIEIILAAYKLTGNEIFLDNTVLLGNSFKVLVKDGGVKVNVKGGYWFEEYASSSTNLRPLVLNGHNFALDALYWLKQEKLEFENEFNQGLNAVIVNISDYYSLMWTYYDKTELFADKKYHLIHIKQIERLNYFTDDELFYDIQKMKILNSLPFGFIERLFYQSNKMVVFIVLFNSFLFFILIKIITFILNRIK